MPTYFDTSSIVPILIAEPGSERCRSLWVDATDILSSTVAHVEVHAALGAAARSGRIDERQLRRAQAHFDELSIDIAYVPVTEAVIASAAGLATRLTLRGYDAVHCATALAVASDDLVAASGDRDLLRAWSALGIHTVDTSA